MFNEMLESMESGEEYYAFAAPEELYNKEFNIFMKNYHRKREVKKVKVKLLSSEELKGKLDKSLANIKGRVIRFTKQVTPRSMLILKDKIAIYVWADNPAGVIIKSRIIAEQNKEFFEEMWKSAED